jgi:hypothetical protein
MSLHRQENKAGVCFGVRYVQDVPQAACTGPCVMCKMCRKLLAQDRALCARCAARCLHRTVRYVQGVPQVACTGPCHGSGGKSPASERGGPESNPGLRGEIYGVQSDTETGFSPSTSVSPVGIIPQMPHLHLNTTPMTRTSGRSLATCRQCNVPVDIEQQLTN